MDYLKEKNIGEISGKVMVFGGVYSNLQALEQLMKIAKAQRISSSNIICTGDIVGYCANPDECLHLIKSWGIHSIAGNVELQLRDAKDSCGCNFDENSRCDRLSQQWYFYAQSQVSADMQSWLKTLPEFIKFSYAGKECFVLHGGYENTSSFIFESTEWSIKQRILDQVNADIILAGHCGIPFRSSHEGKIWLNAGVIGMPANDGNTKVWYLLLDDKDGFVSTFRSFSYDHQTAAAKMKEKGLPDAYRQTLLTGMWDNCDILPAEETKKMGEKINL